MTLARLAVKHGSDKHGHHDYCRHYEKHFSPLKHKPVTLIELGVGGYEFPDRGGAGLRMWSEYFQIGRIFGIDIHDKRKIRLPERTRVFKGSQIDGVFLTHVMQEAGGSADIIIDDASHMNAMTIQSFLHLFPWLRSGGIYVIEDIESSWWDEHGFDGEPDYSDCNAINTFNFIRSLMLDVNAKHVPNYKKEFNIDSVCVYQNMVVITKR